MILTFHVFGALIVDAVTVAAAIPVILLIPLLRDLMKGTSW